MFCWWPSGNACLAWIRCFRMNSRCNPPDRAAVVCVCVCGPTSDHRLLGAMWFRPRPQLEELEHEKSVLSDEIDRLTQVSQTHSLCSRSNRLRFLVSPGRFDTVVRQRTNTTHPRGICLFHDTIIPMRKKKLMAGPTTSTPQLLLMVRSIKTLFFFCVGANTQRLGTRAASTP